MGLGCSMALEPRAGGSSRFPTPSKRRGHTQQKPIRKEHFLSKKWVGPGPWLQPRTLSLSTPPVPHLCQTGISQLAAGCEVQLLQGLQHEQGGALWLGRRVHGA